MRRVLPDTFGSIESHHLEKYLNRTEEGSFADTRPSESRRRLPEAAQDVYELLERFRATSARDLASYRLLEEIFHQQCEVNQKSEPAVSVRPVTKEGCDNIVSPADPDARYNKHKGVGFLLQVMESYSPTEENAEPTQPNLITHVAVQSMATHDKNALAPAIDDVEQGSAKPDMLLADSHYGSQDCLVRGSTRGVTVVSSAQTPRSYRTWEVPRFKLDAKWLESPSRISSEACAGRQCCIESNHRQLARCNLANTTRPPSNRIH